MHNPIYQAAVDTFGDAHQIQKAVGECGELVAELVKYFTDGKSNLDEVAQEVADVEIMMSQLRLIVGNERVEKAKAYKLERLAGLIEKTASDKAITNEPKYSVNKNIGDLGSVCIGEAATLEEARQILSEQPFEHRSGSGELGVTFSVKPINRS